MSYHARLSPSSAKRWTSCTASIGAQDGIENTNSDASRNGTCCHQIQAECLINGHAPDGYLNRKLVFWSHPESDSTGEDWSENYTDQMALEAHWTGEVVVTQEMVDAVTSAVDFVRRLHELKGGKLFVEQSVPIGQFTGEQDATGSTDVALLSDDWCWIADSKYGRAKVEAFDVIEPAHRDIITNEVVPEKLRCNLQMASYALGTIHKFGSPAIQTVTMTIIQPFVNHISEYTCSIEELREVEAFLRAKANETRTNPKFAPNADNCHFCRASGNCKAQDAAILEAVLMGFDNVETATVKPVKDIELGTKYALLPMIQDWCKAVDARVWDALNAGIPVSRSDGLSYKLVKGKRGDRSWTDDTLAADIMSLLDIPNQVVFKQVLRGPAALEPLAKVPKAKKGVPPVPPVISADQWAELQKLITQSEGKPAIALQTDPRPAIANAADGFEDVPQGEPNADLF